MTPEPIPTFLDEDDLARVDALATFYGITRDEMIARIVSTGLAHQERQVRDARARGEGGAS